MNAAILLSGGIGSRLRSDVPKQYIRINGRMLITYVLKTLTEACELDKLVIVAEQEWRELIMEDAKKHQISTKKILGFAAPGMNRQASVLNGMGELLRHIAPGERDGGEKLGSIADEDAVFIHDAARPLLSHKLVRDCFAALPGHDGVMPVLPMKDTVYVSQDKKTVSELLDRSRVFAGQAPEVFRFKKYYRANMALTMEQIGDINGSTEPAILAGMDIVMIPGDEKNFKLTTVEDLERFRNLQDSVKMERQTPTKME